MLPEFEEIIQNENKISNWDLINNFVQYLWNLRFNRDQPPYMNAKYIVDADEKSREFIRKLLARMK